MSKLYPWRGHSIIFILVIFIVFPDLHLIIKLCSEMDKTHTSMSISQISIKLSNPSSKALNYILFDHFHLFRFTFIFLHFCVYTIMTMRIKLKITRILFNLPPLNLIVS